MSQKVTVCGKVSEDVHQRIDVLAERIGWTRSELVAHCIEYGLREGEKFSDRLSGPVLGTIIRMVLSLDTSDPEAVKAVTEVQRRIREQDKADRRIKEALD